MPLHPKSNSNIYLVYFAQFSKITDRLLMLPIKSFINYFYLIIKIHKNINIYIMKQQYKNPFNPNIPASNSTSQQLLILQNKCYIIKKLSLLPLYQYLGTPQNLQNNVIVQLLQLYKMTLEDIISCQIFPYGNYEAVKELCMYLQIYCGVVAIRYTYGSARKQEIMSGDVKIPEWPGFRACFMLIEQKIPKVKDCEYIREYVIVRRGLLEEPKYFLAQRMAKKVTTQELKSLISAYQYLCKDKSQLTFVQENTKNRKQTINTENSMHRKLTFQQIRTKLRSMALALCEGDLQFLQNLEANISHLPDTEHKKILQYANDIKLSTSTLKDSQSMMSKNNQSYSFSYFDSMSSAIFANQIQQNQQLYKPKMSKKRSKRPKKTNSKQKNPTNNQQIYQK